MELSKKYAIKENPEKYRDGEIDDYYKNVNISYYEILLIYKALLILAVDLK